MIKQVISIGYINLKKLSFVDCELKGKVYKSGEKFRKGDGCNECVCMPGGKAQCTNKPCYPGEYVHNSDVLFFSNVENYTKSLIQSVVIVFVGVFFLGGGGFRRR